MKSAWGPPRSWIVGEVQGPCWLEPPLWPEEEEGDGAVPVSALAQAGRDDLCITGRPNSLLQAVGSHTAS